MDGTLDKIIRTLKILIECKILIDFKTDKSWSVKEGENDLRSDDYVDEVMSSVKRVPIWSSWEIDDFNSPPTKI